MALAPEDLVDRRAESDVSSGSIPCRIGGRVRPLPTRKVGPVREWKASLGTALLTGVTGFDFREKPTEAMVDLSRLATIVGDTVLDLVVEYDVTGALGGRDWLEANADDREVYEILRSILAVHFPFVRDLRDAIREVMALLAVARSDQASSPSSPSPSGDSTPTV